MKILFLIYHGFSDVSGISKKIHYQIDGLRSAGHDVCVCTYSILDNRHRCRMIDGNIISDFGHGRFAALKKRCSFKDIVNYATKNHIQFVYARSFHNANPFTIHMFRQFRRKGIKSVIEIPTYPYDAEYVGFPLTERIQLIVDKMFRHSLALSTDAIVTFTDDTNIFGQRTIRISNGIDLNSIPLRKQNTLICQNNSSINFIAVAEVHYWHGFDRFIQGMGEYYKNGGKQAMLFHIVGGIAPCEMHDSAHAPGFQELIDKYHIEGKVIFHGQMFGQPLDELFDQCQFAVGSLARHRSGVYNIKTLKNREYAARGIPFIYSETDSDFDNKPYILKAPADETPININSLLHFMQSLNIAPSEIRATTTSLTWQKQMTKVIAEFI
jgi:glycosyltransferase involved in cell wall biosynthesis